MSIIIVLYKTWTEGGQFMTESREALNNVGWIMDDIPYYTNTKCICKSQKLLLET